MLPTGASWPCSRDHLGNLGLHHFGEYDWLSIGEFPNHRADLAVLIAGASKGAVSDLKTTIAVTPEEFALACADAAGLAPEFKAAGFE